MGVNVGEHAATQSTMWVRRALACPVNEDVHDKIYWSWE